ncbi:MAG: hypothetical protein ACLUPV_01690 [Bilophila wadsworthia]
MKLLFKGPVIITESSQLGMALARAPGGRRENAPVAVRPKGSHVAGKRGFPAFPLMNRKACRNDAGGCSVNRPPIWST